MEVRKKI